MRQVHVYIETDKIGSTCEDVLEFDDEATDDEIESDAKDWAFSHVQWGWKEQEHTK